MTAKRPDLDALLPHGGVARLVTGIRESSSDEIVCEGRVPEASPFVRKGSAPAFITLELAAQAAAVLEALQGAGTRTESTARVGYLVRIRRARTSRARIPVGMPLVVRVRRQGAAGSLRIYRASVEQAGAVLLRGTVSTFVDPLR